MVAWVAPATFTSTTLPASLMNTEVRDHALWLKAFADLITNSTAADSGNSTFLAIARATSGAGILRGIVTGDANPRFLITNDNVQWGDGTNPADTFLSYKTAIDAQRGMLLAGNAAGTSAGPSFYTAAGTAGLGSIGAVLATNWAIQVTLAIQSSTQPTIEFSRADGYVSLRSDAAARLIVRAPGSNPRFGLSNESAAEVNSIFAWVEGDTQPRAAIGLMSGGPGRLALGPGGSTAPDAILYRSQANELRTDGAMFSAAGIRTFSKNGAVTDADFPFTPGNGMLAVDVSGSKLYVRAGSWKSVTIA